MHNFREINSHQTCGNLYGFCWTYCFSSVPASLCAPALAQPQLAWCSCARLYHNVACTTSHCRLYYNVIVLYFPTKNSVTTNFQFSESLLWSLLEGKSVASCSLNTSSCILHFPRFHWIKLINSLYKSNRFGERTPKILIIYCRTTSNTSWCNYSKKCSTKGHFSGYV